MAGVAFMTDAQQAAFDAESDAAARWGGGGGGGNSPAAASGYSFVIPGVPTNHDPISGGWGATDSVASHYYHGYWAGVQGGLYGFGSPPSAIHGYGAWIIDAIGAAFVPPAQAGEFDSGRRSFDTRFLPQISGGGFRITEEMFATDSDSAGSGQPVTRADIEAELAGNNQPSASGSAPNWQTRVASEFAFDSDAFPYPGGGLPEYRLGMDFFNANTYIGRSGGIIGYTNSALPAFPVYNYMFGEGYPPLLMGKQHLTLSGEFWSGGTPIPIFEWGDLIPFRLLPPGY